MSEAPKTTPWTQANVDEVDRQPEEKLSPEATIVSVPISTSITKEFDVLAKILDIELSAAISQALEQSLMRMGPRLADEAIGIRECDTDQMTAVIAAVNESSIRFNIANTISEKLSSEFSPQALQRIYEEIAAKIAIFPKSSSAGGLPNTLWLNSESCVATARIRDGVWQISWVRLLISPEWRSPPSKARH